MIFKIVNANTTLKNGLEFRENSVMYFLSGFGGKKK